MVFTISTIPGEGMLKLTVPFFIFMLGSLQAQETEMAYRNLRQITADTENWNFDIEIQPAGDNIIYTSDRTDPYGDILIQPLKGSSQIQKTFHEGTDRHPSYSPDGERFAFASDANGNFDIFVMRTNGGTAKQQVTFSDLDELSPDFSPDGKKLVYVSYGIDGGNIWIYNFDDGSFTTLGKGEYPKFSPDGTKLVYQKRSSNKDRYYSLWIINIDGSSDTQIVRGNDWSAITPDWSPNGEYIVFASSANKIGKYVFTRRKSKVFIQKEAKGTDIWVVKIDGTGMTQLTQSKGSDWNPKWTNENVIYFCSDRRLGRKPSNKASNIWSFIPLLVE